MHLRTQTHQEGLLQPQASRPEKSGGMAPVLVAEWEKVSEMELHRRCCGSGFADSDRYEFFLPSLRPRMGWKLLWQPINFRPTVAAVFGATV
ncbi:MULTISPECIES: hypothetical protein [unclassified Microcoleus]|uniref:hypothetical protein n=1 Tax=unclassified Microcoleus TaxID=2642155 RepID=UPI002FD3E447